MEWANPRNADSGGQGELHLSDRRQTHLATAMDYPPNRRLSRDVTSAIQHQYQNQFLGTHPVLGIGFYHILSASTPPCILPGAP